jgi:hypothetical protein
MGFLQDAELEFELNAFDDDKEAGSEKDVDYMERMMAMLINARGNDSTWPFFLMIEMGREMNLDERKRFAQRTVEQVAKMS